MLAPEPGGPPGGLHLLRSSVLAPLCISLASALAAVALAEVVLRVVYPAPVVWRYPQERYAWDAETGHRLRPDQIAFTHDRPVSINSRGLRDREFPAAVAPGTVRILALGDSQTFGNGLDLADTWPKQLESHLEAAGAGRFEVLNGGVPGTDTWQHAILLDRLLRAYEVDAVVLAVYVNDVTPAFDPAARPLAPESDGGDRRLVYLLKRSSLLLVLRAAWVSLRLAVDPDPGALAEQHVITGEPDPRADAGWQTFARGLAAMKSRCDGAGIPLFVVVLPRRDQVAAGDPPTAYNRHVATVARELDVPALDLLEPLREARARKVPLFIPWDGHNAPAANRIIAGRVAELLRERCREGACR